MSAWRGYSSHFYHRMRKLHLTGFETTLFVSLVLMLLISAGESMIGRNIGNAEALQLVKAQAQQELMALRTAHSE